MPDNNSSDRLIRKREILADIGIDATTLFRWVNAGTFPLPVVLNPGYKRELVAWRESDYVAWKRARPMRTARPMTEKAYEGRRRRRAAATPKLERPQR